jgi:NitT/TauT family transport system substrate-binding protein
MHITRRSFISALGAFCLWPLLPACRSSRPLTVAIHPWIGYEPIRLASEFNWLSPTVKLVVTKELSASAAALSSGQVDAACLTLDTALHLRSDGLPLTVVLVFDVSAGADVVLARQNIRTLSDLAGKRIGLDTNDLGPLVLASLLDMSGLPLSSVKTVDCPIADQVAAWRANKIDAAITYELTATLLQREGARRLFDSRQMPDTIVDVLAVRNDRLADSPAGLRSLIDCHFRGLSHLQTNRQDAIYRISGRQGISPDEVQQALSGVMLPSLAANREYLVAGGRLHQAAQKLADSMQRHDLLKSAVPLDHLISSAWLPVDERK